jgi:hypothetical protein
MVTGYSPVPLWGRLPQGISLGGDATCVAVDSDDNIYTFNRGSIPVVVLDRGGNYLDSWGAGDFDGAHGICVDGEDHVYLVDTRGHFVQKRTREGKVVLTIGTRGEPAALRSGRYFNRPTAVAVHPVSGEIFVTDGYGNARVHRFGPDGTHILSFGEPGADDGQFCLPHGIDFLDDSRIVVCDRENFRVQVWTVDGEYLSQWHAHRPAAITRDRNLDLLFVAELGYAGQHGVPNVGCRISVRSVEGAQLCTLGDSVPGLEPGQFFAPHGVAIDSRGDLYVAEVNYSYTVGDLRREAPRFEMASLRKWETVRPQAQ